MKIFNSHIRLSQSLAGLCLLVCGLILFNFFGNSARGYIDTTSLFYWWGFQWFNPQSQTEHGPIILVLSLWLFTRNLKRPSLDHNSPSPWLGLFIIMSSLLLHIFGYLVQQSRISIVGFLVFLIGSSYFLGGSRWGKASIFPCTLMLFALPLEFLTNAIGFTMRLNVIKVSYFLAQFCGIDIIRSGTQLLSADGAYQYDVAPACSGIRSLVALSALSLILGYLSFRSWWRRILLFALSIPYAFVGNVIRIFTIIIVAELFGQKAGTLVHEWFGFIIFIIVLGLAMLTVSLLCRYLPESEKKGEDLINSRPEDSDSGIKAVIPFTGVGTTVLIITLLLSSLFTAILTRRIDAISHNGKCGIALAGNEVDPVPFPSMLNIDWAGREYPVSEVEKDNLPPDTGFSRKSYVNLLHPEQEVKISIVLSGKDRSSIHRPELCLVGQGWTIKDNFSHNFKVSKMKGGLLPATVLRVEHSVNSADGTEVLIPALFAYWFVGADTVVPTHGERLFHMARERLFGFNVNRWAYVFAQTICPDGEDAGLQRLQEVIALTVDQFQEAGFTKKDES